MLYTNGDRMFESIGEGVSAHVIIEPLFYRRFVKHSFEYYKEHKSELGKIDVPKYLVCVFTSEQMVEDWTSFLTTFKIIPVFVVDWEDGLIKQLESQFSSSNRTLSESLKLVAKSRGDKILRKRIEKK